MARSVWRSLKSVFHPEPRIVVCSLLTVVGDVKQPNGSDAGCMVVDLLLLLTLLSSQSQFDPTRFRHFGIQDLLPHFPDGKFVFSEAASDPLRWPVPACLYRQHHKDEASAYYFAAECTFVVAAAASTVKKGEKFILILIGHGALTRNNRFCLCISTTGGRDMEAFVTKEQLEMAVKGCRGEVLVLCNSCHAWALESPRWHLLSTSGPHEYAEVLTPSVSDYVRRSAFSWCLLPAAAQEQGFSIPRPCSQKYPVDSNINDLAEHSGCGFLPWRSAIPIALTQTQSVIDSISLYPDLNTALMLNVFYDKAPTGKTSTVMTVSDLRCQLDLLAPDYALLPMTHLREGRDVARSRQYLANRESLSDLDVRDLVFGLHSRNVQAVGTQLVAKHLGWWRGSQVAAFKFISLERTTPGRGAFAAMVEDGIPIDRLFLHLLEKFERHVCGDSILLLIDSSLRLCREHDRGSVWWLVMRWVDAGRPKVPRQQWDLSVDAAADEAVKFVLIPADTQAVY
ncbi:hypothetical protein BDZ89DRAFT_1059760 [Hymenopellis radicata]|nr:hypothetical protein BDZ89DRAFT_1059760 [Hymenopellis radicata]